MNEVIIYFRFGIKRLFGHVDPSKCKYTQKTNTLIIRLAKEKDGHWDQLAYKEGAVNQNISKS